MKNTPKAKRRHSTPFRWKKAHQQLAAVSVAALLMLSLFSIMLIPNAGDGATGFAYGS